MLEYNSGILVASCMILGRAVGYSGLLVILVTILPFSQWFVSLFSIVMGTFLICTGAYITWKGRVTQLTYSVFGHLSIPHFFDSVQRKQFQSHHKRVPRERVRNSQPPQSPGDTEPTTEHRRRTAKVSKGVVSEAIPTFDSKTADTQSDVYRSEQYPSYRSPEQFSSELLRLTQLEHFRTTSESVSASSSVFSNLYAWVSVETFQTGHIVE